VIRVFEERFPERAAAEPERMARYCEAGTLTEESVAYRQRAAGIASERFAAVEAIGHLTRAIELLSTLPECPPRGQQELELQVALGAAYCSTKGWGSREAGQAYERARQLGEEIGETRQLFTVIRGLLTCYVSRVELDTAVELSARLLKLAEESGDPLRRMLAHHQAGLLQMFRGRQAESLRHMREALTYTGPGVDRDLATLYQSDPQVLARTWGAWPLWLTGMPEQALRSCQEAIEIAREGRHPHSLAHANASMAMIRLWRRERDAAAEAAEQALEICREHSFGTMAAGCTVSHSLSRIHPQASPASVEDALCDFGQAAGQLGELGGGCVRPLTLGLLAEALISVGRAEEAREAVNGALVFSGTSGAQYWEAELHRVRAGLLAATGADAPEVNAALQRAVDVAREQGARMLELRAAVDLLRLTQSPEDRASLQGVYDTFDEGVELPDLAAACTLLHTTARA
jgi:tetratricopeptide (TPR) repeat protein